MSRLYPLGKHSYLPFKLVTLELSATTTTIPYHRIFVLGLSYLAFKLAALALTSTNTMNPIEANVHSWSSLCLPNDLVLSQTHVLLYGFILHCHVGSDLVLSQAVQAWRLFMKPKFFSISPSAFMWHFISFVHDLVLSRKHLAILIGMLRAGCKLEPTIIIEELGEGRIRATWGWISVDRGSKATLPLTMPRRVFKSSAKDSAHRPLGRELRGGRPRHFGRTGLANGTGPWGRKRP